MSFAPKTIGKAQNLAKIGPVEIWSSQRTSDFDAKNWILEVKKSFFRVGFYVLPLSTELKLEPLVTL